MASSDRGLRAERVTEVIVELPGEGGRRRGSGYLVSAGKALTAAHVVEGAARVWVRLQADRPGERIVVAAVAWQHTGIDVAVLTLPRDAPEGSPLVLYGRVGETDAVLHCTAVGFPRFKLRTDEDGSRYRDAEHVNATCAVLSNRREGTLDLGVSSPPPDDPHSGRDVWEGMSGAAVFSNDRLVGIVTRHHRSEGPGRIAAGRVDRWAETLNATELAELESILGCGLRAAVLSDVVKALSPVLIEDAHRAYLADIAPEELRDREAELGELVAFCGGHGPYLWLQGPPWAGKTALAAWFALHPPRGVVPVWFFITARLAGQADSSACTAALVDQLAAIVGRERTARGSATALDGERRLLLREAAEHIGQDGGTLLLVVDGLDEDQSLLPGGNGTSIASLLPERLPPNLRVLVTSRGSPELPADVRGAHPLRHCRVVRLSATEEARHTEIEARFDLQQALYGDELQRDLVGLLTAARATLTMDDLRELTGAPHTVLRARLGSAFARILRLRGGRADSRGDVHLYMADRGYLFAHETLLITAQEELGPDVGLYRERLHAWAAAYERQGWPANTPAYLLQPYGRLIPFLEDTRRAVALTTDVRRRDRLSEATGSDAACRGEIAAMRQTIERSSPHDLGALASLTVAADLVARRSESLHPDIPAVYARLGHVRRAIGLARSVFRTMDRARALTGVARVLVHSGDRRAIALAEEAVELAQEAQDVVAVDWSSTHDLAAHGMLAIALVAAGRKEDALRRLGELSLPTVYSHAVRAFVEAFTGTAAAAVEEPEWSADVLRRVEEAADGCEDRPTRVRALTGIADARAARGDFDHAVRLYDAAVGLAGPYDKAPPDVLEAAAETLRRARPREVERMARSALARAGRLRDRGDVDQDEVRGIVCTLAAAGRVDDAERLMKPLAAGVQDYDCWYRMWQAIAEGRAREGRVVEAWTALEASWRYDGLFSESHQARTVTHIVERLVAAGATDELEAWLSNERGAWPRYVSEGLTALAAHFAGDAPDRSMRLLRQAEVGRHSMGRPVPTVDSERVVALAGAVALAGRPDDAERLLRVIDDPGVRGWGFAAVSVALAGEDAQRAVRLAEAAADTVRESDEGFTRAGVLAASARVMACAGFADRALEILEELAGETPDDHWHAYCRWCARADVAAGLRPYDPETADRLFEALLHEAPTASEVARAHLLATVDADDERAARIKNLLTADTDDRAQPAEDEEPLAILLTASIDVVAARQRIERTLWEFGWTSTTGTPEVLAYAAFGQFEEACATARNQYTEDCRSEAIADLAAYVARVPGNSLTTPRSPLANVWLPTIRRLTSAHFPPPSGPDLPRARSLVAEALTPDGWHHALPVLAAIDPDAIHGVRDVVFAHLGLGD
ncbi:trypsin-like peptidase domain-containing protein [Streptomyces milbemycinicus]|uniref:trypsin-like peptidase domain-containing protein n=1 Tax=Streptomyces milbemycinicus TaxID=476552 RepID=UPI0033E953DE